MINLMSFRDRIRELRRVPASELRAHPRNWRQHPPSQLRALRAMLADIGFAGAALARELDDGTLELIDGHLRAETAGDGLIPVLVLDVTADEADRLLLSFDPLGTMATADAARLADLLQATPVADDSLRAILDELAQLPEEAAPLVPASELADETGAQFHILIECRSEAEQVALLERFTTEGLPCRALIS